MYSCHALLCCSSDSSSSSSSSSSSESSSSESSDSDSDSSSDSDSAERRRQKRKKAKAKAKAKAAKEAAAAAAAQAAPVAPASKKTVASRDYGHDSVPDDFTELSLRDTNPKKSTRSKATPAPAAADYSFDDDPFTSHKSGRHSRPGSAERGSSGGLAVPESKAAPTRTCSVYGCGQKRTMKGYCATHARDPNAPVTKPMQTSLADVVATRCKQQHIIAKCTW